MAECHPVGFQWVMEAKARGAKVIHVDPRFTRTSAVADTHVPIRAGSDIAFLGAIINYILSNDKYFHDYVVAYTNAATLVSEDFVDVDDLDGVFSGYDPETGTYDTSSWSYEGMGEHSAGGGPASDPGSGGRGLGRGPGGSGGESEGSASERGAAHELGGHGASLDHAQVERDETLQHPRTVFQVLKRHFARYTPEMVQDTCGISPEQLLEVCESVTANSGRDKTTCWVYSVGWTHHTVGVQMIRTSAIIQLLLGNMGRPGRRHHGAPRARQHPGLDRHPDAVQPAARVPADAEGRAARLARRVRRRDREPAAEGLLGQRQELRRQPAQGVVGRRGDGGERLRLLLPAAADRRPRHVRDRDVDAARRDRRLLPARAEPGGGLGPRQDAAAGAGAPEVARGPRPQPDRVRDVLVRRTGDRDGRAEDRRDRHRGLLLPRRRARREGRHVHPDPTDAAVAPQGGRARPGTARATWTSSTCWGRRSGSGWPARRTSGTGPSSTSRGTTRCTRTGRSSPRRC